MAGKPVLSATVIVLGVIVCIMAAFAFKSSFFRSPDVKTSCKDLHGQEFFYIPGDSVTKEYADCINLNAKLFLEKDFEQTKDLSKSFLTLLAGLLVGSITFSEKIVDIHTASRTTRTSMVCCWIFLLSAIITCGVGLALMTMAAGWASYQPFRDFRVFERPAMYLFVSAGLTFGSGMVCLLIAGTISMNERKSALT